VNIHAYEVHANEVYSHEMYAHDVHAYEMHAHEMHAREMHAREMHARKIYARLDSGAPLSNTPYATTPLIRHNTSHTPHTILQPHYCWIMDIARRPMRWLGMTLAFGRDLNIDGYLLSVNNIPVVRKG
jgi:hypothetical protein